MAHKPAGVDVILAMGGPKKPPVADEADYGADGDDSELPPDFEVAWRDYHDHPSAQTFWNAVEACTGHKVSSDARMKKADKPYRSDD